MLVGMIPATVWAENSVVSGIHGDNLSWNFDKSTGALFISGTGDMECCKSEEYPWHDLWNAVLSVELESGITSIADDAFEGMPKLTKVVIPDTVTSIGDLAFYSCSDITDIVIPNSVTSIGDYAFDHCGKITAVTFSEDITYIGEYAFWGCAGITAMTFLGDAPQTIGEEAFHKVTATVSYPAHNATWSEEIKQNYGGTIT